MNFKKSNITRNESKTACSRCTHRCCDHMPGSVYPSQLKTINFKSIVKLLQNNYCIDWWEGDPRATTQELSQCYYIRPRTIGHENDVFYGAWAGKCVFLTPTGCSHSFAQRPMECQALEPNEAKPGSCTNKINVNKQNAAIAWIPYQALLKKAGGFVAKEEDNKIKQLFYG